MLRDAYRIFETPEGSFLLVRLEDLMEMMPAENSLPIRPAQLERMCLADQSGSKWVFYQEGEQVRDFIKLLALSENTTRKQIKGRITRHRLSGMAELMMLILNTRDPSALEEIERFRRISQG
jgi:hypothetical protein